MMAADSILGGGAMARSWSSYLAVMCNKPSTYFQIPFHGFDLDFMAVAAVGVVTTVLVLGSKHTAMVNGGEQSHGGQAFYAEITYSMDIDSMDISLTWWHRQLWLFASVAFW